ncbi:MAG: CPBP family intramembrane glutamic endopeptidase [Kineosporiaceae bacterium]
MTTSTTTSRPWQLLDRRSGWQYPLGSLSFIAAQGCGLVLGTALNAGVYGSGATSDVEAHPWPGLALALGVQAAIAVALYRLMIRLLARRPVHELSRDGAAAEFGRGLALGAGMIAVVAGILALTGSLRISGASLNTGILVGLMMGVGAGFAEEILFRGVLLRLLDQHVGSWPALAVTAVLFGGLHLLNPGATAWGAVAIMIEAGVMLGAAYLYTRRLWLPIGIHLAWNAVLGGVIGGTVSGTELGGPAGLFTSHLTGPDWLDGGTIGLEGSIVTVVVGLALGTWLLRGAARRGHLTPAHLPWLMTRAPRPSR